MALIQDQNDPTADIQAVYQLADIDVKAFDRESAKKNAFTKLKMAATAAEKKQRARETLAKASMKRSFASLDLTIMKLDASVDQLAHTNESLAAQLNNQKYVRICFCVKPDGTRCTEHKNTSEYPGMFHAPNFDLVFCTRHRNKMKNEPAFFNLQYKLLNELIDKVDDEVQIYDEEDEIPVFQPAVQPKVNPFINIAPPTIKARAGGKKANDAYISGDENVSGDGEYPNTDVEMEDAEELSTSADLQREMEAMAAKVS